MQVKIRTFVRRCLSLGPLLLLVVGLPACGNVAAKTTTPQALVNEADSPISTSPSAGASVFISPVQATRPLVTSTPTLTATPSPTRTPTSTPTKTPIPTDTPLPTITPTATTTPTPQPTPTYIADSTARQVPILMYHYLSQPPPGSDAIRRDLSVSPENFESHLAYLRQAGYETISLADLAYSISQGTTLPEKPIIITFDDGYRDNYENAFPLLKQYGYKATFFIFTQPIDTYNVAYLTWEMVIEMHQAGMEFGSHTYRHPDLRNRDADFLIYEIVGSKEAIETRIGEPVRFFAYPSGHYDDLTIKVLDSAHFWGAVTTQWGSLHSYANRFELPRIRVRGSDRAEDLAKKLP